MTLDPGAARFLEMAGAVDRRAEAPSCEDYRRGYAELFGFAAMPPADLVSTSNMTVVGPAGPIPVRILAPSDAGTSALPVHVWLHGGGWIAGGLDACEALCRGLALAARRRIAIVDYRLAPEHPFPAGADDCLAAITELWANADDLGFDRNDFAIGANSAGVHLAAGVVPAAVRAGVRLASAFFLCPVVDPFGDWPSRREFARGFLLEEADLTAYARLYGIDRDNPDERISPLRSASLADFPPTVLHIAEYDPVRDEGEALGRALADAGVRVRQIRHQGLIHNFHALTGVVPAARRALDEIGRSLNAPTVGAADVTRDERRT